MDTKALSDFLDSTIGGKIGMNIGESFSEVLKILTKGLTNEEKIQLVETFETVFKDELKETQRRDFWSILEKKVIE